jgi:hypothetical protein
MPFILSGNINDKLNKKTPTNSHYNGFGYLA